MARLVRLVRGCRAAAGLITVAMMLSGCGGHPPQPAARTTSAASYRVLVDAGLHLYRTHDLNAAEQLLIQAIRRDRRLPLAYYDLGVVYESEGLIQAALAEFMHATSVAPAYVPALYDQAVVEGVLHHTRYAIALYRQVIATRPDSPTAYLNLGLLEFASRDTAQAVHDLRHAVHLDPALASRVPTPLRARVR